MTIPTPLKRSTPRQVRLSTAGRALTLLSFVLALAAPVAGVALHMKAVRDSERAHVRVARGVITDGRITQVDPKRGKDERARVHYSFTVNGVTYDNTTRIRKRSLDARGLEPGKSVQIGYLPEAPSDSWIVGFEPRAGEFFPGPIVALTTLSMAVLLFVRIRRAVSLLANGKAAVAVATGSKRIRHQHGHTDKVLFEFRLPNGARRKGSAVVRKVPPIGSELIVVYDPENPARVAKYPLRLVTVETDF